MNPGLYDAKEPKFVHPLLLTFLRGQYEGVETVITLAIRKLDDDLYSIEVSDSAFGELSNSKATTFREAVALLRYWEDDWINAFEDIIKPEGRS